MSSDELKPCPFCGGAASYRLYYGGRYRVHCNECGCHLEGLFDTESEAGAAWNNRHKKAPSINVLLAQFGYHYAATTSVFKMRALVDEYAGRIREAVKHEEDE